MTRWVAVFLLIGTLLFTACSSGSDNASDAADDGPTVDASGTITGDQVCTLVSAEDVGNALDFEVTDTQPQNTGTPGCVWYYETETEINGVVLAVLTDEDVENNEGDEAFDYVLDLNRVFSNNVKEEKVSAGDQAVFMTGQTNKILIMQDGKKVLTLAGQALTKDGATDIGKKAASRLK